jgi:hypothetical protein
LVGEYEVLIEEEGEQGTARKMNVNMRGKNNNTNQRRETLIRQGLARI